jgi:osmotically-inducible protein OsmY
MIEKAALLGHGEIDALILRALVRKLLANCVLSADDVRALLFDAATRLDLVGSDLTPGAAHVIVEQDLAPAFVGNCARRDFRSDRQPMREILSARAHGMVDSPFRAEELVTKNDAELGQDVEKELHCNPKVDASNVTVTTKNGVVTLTGRVQNYATKCEAESVVKRIVGVTGLADDLEVTLVGEQPNDTDLTERVLQALKANVFVPSETITSVVHDGWVTLRGKALYYYQKLDAENVLRHLRGVKGITDSIVIDNPDKPQDLNQTIITDALSRNARIDADQITVKVDGHTATLEGSVRCLAERDEAELAAWAAPGVNSVENYLVVR